MMNEAQLVDFIYSITSMANSTLIPPQINLVRDDDCV